MNSDKSIADLIAVASQELEQKLEIKKLSEAHEFILAKGVKAGETKILAITVYETYKSWKGKKALSKPKFFIQFAKIFPRYRTNKYTYYLLNAEPFNLSEEHYKQHQDSTSKKTSNEEISQEENRSKE